MGLVFVDGECSVCGGEGCDHCEGTGIRGECVEMPDIRLPEPSPWAQELRAWRLDAGLTWKELGEMTGTGADEIAKLQAEDMTKKPTDFPGAAALCFALAEIDVDPWPDWGDRTKLYGGPADELGGY